LPHPNRLSTGGAVLTKRGGETRISVRDNSVAKSPSKCLSDPDYKNLRKRYRNILTRGEKEPGSRQSPGPGRGKTAGEVEVH